MDRQPIFNAVRTMLGAVDSETLEYLRAAGFSNIETHKLSHDIQNNWYVVTGGPG